MKFYQNGEALAQDMGVPLSVLEETHQVHYEAAQKTEKDPDGGSYPAYPSGKSWDEPSGKTGSGKKFYHNMIPGSAVKSEPFYVAIITPVIHYCMGGLEIDADGAVLGGNGVIKGLYCAGEVAGGVHGNNRLGGNSLLDCVVFGRVTGEAATKYILGGDVKKVDLKELTKGGLSGEVKASKFSGGSYEEGMNDGKANAAAKAAPAETKVAVNWPDAPSTHDGIPGSPYLLVAGGRSDVSPRVACFEDSTGRTMAGIVAACLVFAFIAINYMTPQPS
jgi:hypothetical protein